jgi:hypothetical protein
LLLVTPMESRALEQAPVSSCQNLAPAGQCLRKP